MSGSRSWRASSNSFRALAMSLSRHTTPSLSWCQGSTGQRVRKWGTALLPEDAACVAWRTFTGRPKLPQACYNDLTCKILWRGRERERESRAGQRDLPREVAGGTNDVAVQPQSLFPLDVGVGPRAL